MNTGGLLEIIKGTLRGSPYVGIFGIVTEDVVIVPHSASNAEVKNIEDNFGAEVVRTGIAGSSLVGVFVAAVGKKLAVPAIASEREVRELENMGFGVLKLEELTALGNLVVANSRGGIASRLIGKENVRRLSRFFGVELVQGDIAGTELPGACVAASESGFISHPRTSAEEFTKLAKAFGVSGATTTANYGDVFVGNDVIANSRAALVGLHTSGHELIRIDEGLRGG